MTRSQTLWWGTLTLTAAAMVSRGLGLVYRVLLARYLGPEGLGLFQMVFPFYITLVTLTAAGTPMAVSQMVADGRYPAPVIGRAARVFTLGLALPIVTVVFVAARPLAMFLYHDMAFISLLQALSPAVLAVALSSVFRGLFMGRQRMEVPAASQVVEQAVRVLALGLLLGGNTIAPIPLTAVWILVLGESVSLGLLWIGWQDARPTAADGALLWPAFQDLFRLSWPLTLGRLLGSLTGLMEASWIPLRLQLSGLTQTQSIALFGQMTGMALPLIFFPTSLTWSLAVNLVPAVAQDAGRLESVRRRIHQSLYATAVWSCPITAILLGAGTRLDDILFATDLPRLLFIPLVVGGFFHYFDIILVAILRGLGRTDIPLRNNLWGSALELLLILVLVGQPGFGVTGAALAVAMGFLISAVLNHRALTRLTGHPIAWRTILLPPALAASLPGILVGPLFTALTPAMGDLPGLTVAIVAVALLYLLALGSWGGPFLRLLYRHHR